MNESDEVKQVLMAAFDFARLESKYNHNAEKSECVTEDINTKWNDETVPKRKKRHCKYKADHSSSNDDSYDSDISSSRNSSYRSISSTDDSL
jgi:hypothetical protein